MRFDTLVHATALALTLLPAVAGAQPRPGSAPPPIGSSPSGGGGVEIGASSMFVASLPTFGGQVSIPASDRVRVEVGTHVLPWLLEDDDDLGVVTQVQVRIPFRHGQPGSRRSLLVGATAISIGNRWESADEWHFHTSPAARRGQLAVAEEQAPRRPDRSAGRHHRPVDALRRAVRDVLDGLAPRSELVVRVRLAVTLVLATRLAGATVTAAQPADDEPLPIPVPARVEIGARRGLTGAYPEVGVLASVPIAPRAGVRGGGRLATARGLRRRARPRPGAVPDAVPRAPAIPEEPAGRSDSLSVAKERPLRQRLLGERGPRGLSARRRQPAVADRPSRRLPLRRPGHVHVRRRAALPRARRSCGTGKRAMTLDAVAIVCWPAALPPRRRRRTPPVGAAPRLEIGARSGDRHASIGAAEPSLGIRRRLTDDSLASRDSCGPRRADVRRARRRRRLSPATGLAPLDGLGPIRRSCSPTGRASTAVDVL